MANGECLAKAAEMERRAAVSWDRQTRTVYRDMAEIWRLLGRPRDAPAIIDSAPLSLFRPRSDSFPIRGRSRKVSSGLRVATPVERPASALRRIAACGEVTGARYQACLCGQPTFLLVRPHQRARGSLLRWPSIGREGLCQRALFHRLGTGGSSCGPV
jgi:hypothetical protein